jgi:hypothetical protein
MFKLTPKSSSLHFLKGHFKMATSSAIELYLIFWDVAIGSCLILMCRI